MNTKINVTPDMIKLSKVILKNLEQLSGMVKRQNKNLGIVSALCTSGGNMEVTIHDEVICYTVDIEGNVNNLSMEDKDNENQ